MLWLRFRLLNVYVHITLVHVSVCVSVVRRPSVLLLPTLSSDDEDGVVAKFPARFKSSQASAAMKTAATIAQFMQLVPIDSSHLPASLKTES